MDFFVVLIHNPVNSTSQCQHTVFSEIDGYGALIKPKFVGKRFSVSTVDQEKHDGQNKSSCEFARGVT